MGQYPALKVGFELFFHKHWQATSMRHLVLECEPVILDQFVKEGCLRPSTFVAKLWSWEYPMGLLHAPYMQRLGPANGLHLLDPTDFSTRYPVGSRTPGANTGRPPLGRKMTRAQCLLVIVVGVQGLSAQLASALLGLRRPFGIWLLNFFE